MTLWSVIERNAEVSLAIPIGHTCRLINAAEETHAGAEYRFSRLALRAGWWHDPARFDDARYEFTPFVHSADHMTFGAGLKLANAEVSFDLDDPHDNNGRRASLGLTYAF
jgi:hypothetical protein